MHDDNRNLMPHEHEEHTMSKSHKPLDRRAILGSALVTAAGGAAMLAATPAPAATATGSAENSAGWLPEPRVSGSFTVTDNRGRQRFRLDSRKPPVIVDGQEIPASQRGGPEHASWLIFNDDNGNEIGGVLGSTTGGSITFDYPGAIDAIKMSSIWRDGAGGAGLNVNARPGDQPATGPRERVLLGWRSDRGSILHLLDSRGRPRIVLEVDSDDVPAIKILDGDGNVTARLPAQ